MPQDSQPSFSRKRKWLLSLNVLVSTLAVLALVVMANYMAARHFKRFSLSPNLSVQLSPLTQSVLDSVTNEVRVTLYFDQDDPLYETVRSLLREYRYANQNIQINSVDYQRDPAAASLVKARHNLNQLADRDMIIFEANNRTKFVQRGELSELDVEPLMTGQSREVRRTHFKGELMFTSALFSLYSSRPLKAYFLQNHGEHSPASDDPDIGYSKFAAVLARNNIEWAPLALTGTNDVPADCNLLIIAGPASPLLPEELKKLSAYIDGGGRLMVLLNYYGLQRTPGLTGLLSGWEVDVGNNIVRDLPNSYNREDMVITRFGTHPIVKPLVRSGLYLIVPRSVSRKADAPARAGAPEVSELFYTGNQATIITDIRQGVPYPSPADVVTNVSLAVAVEKGRIKDVTADRGTTRMVVVGESLFLSNRMIDSAANDEFAGLAVNWLLDRSELLGNLGPRPVREFQTALTTAEMTGVRWILLAAMPASVLLIGLLVWLARRR